MPDPSVTLLEAAIEHVEKMFWSYEGQPTKPVAILLAAAKRDLAHLRGEESQVPEFSLGELAAAVQQARKNYVDGRHPQSPEDTERWPPDFYSKLTMAAQRLRDMGEHVVPRLKRAAFRAHDYIGQGDAEDLLIKLGEMR